MSEEKKSTMTIEELRPYSIFVATPMYGGMCTGSYTKSLTELSMICAQQGIMIKHYFLFNESLIQRARNYCVAEFLRSECTHMLFIDADVSFKPQDVLTMLALQIAAPEKYDVVCAPYPKKTIAWEKVRKAVEEGRAKESPFHLEQYIGDYTFNPIKKEGKETFALNEPLEVAEGATGFMIIPRYVFEKFQLAYPELSYKPDHARTENFDGSTEITAFFDCIIDPATRRYLSEDYFFSQKVREAGMSVWMCPWMNLNHTGTYVFRGNLSAIASLPNTSATASRESQRDFYAKKQAPSPVLGQNLRNQKQRNRNKK